VARPPRRGGLVHPGRGTDPHHLHGPPGDRRCPPGAGGARDGC
jgi:hypothetical protein